MPRIVKICPKMLNTEMVLLTVKQLPLWCFKKNTKKMCSIHGKITWNLPL